MSPRPHLPQPGLLARLFGSRRLHELQARAQAMDRVQAVVEFELDGTLRHANRNFLELFGYRLEEIRGQHHRLFVPVAERESAAYRGLWAKLGRGEFDAGRYRRIAKDGRTLWIQASYNPILDARGRPRGVIKFATDISAQMLHEADVSGQLAAINRSMAVIEFALDGTILHANPNFLRALGYQEHEVVGQHHRLFVDATTRDSAAYREFWARLAQGEHQSGSFHRIGKGGREVWIEASYSPILDPEGRPFKVVKYAADITEQVLRRADFESQIAALRKVQAVIEFELDGTIRDANPAFLEAVGYRLDEIRGQHHRLFVDPAEAASPAYRAFWEKLGRGEFDRGEYRRLAKGGREIWLQASYNPILTPEGRPYKVVKFALDVTAKVRLAASLRQLVQRMDGLAAQISQASAEIAQGNADLASRTEHQAGNIAATAGAMQTLTATVRRNADDTQQANQLTLETADVARAGGEVMQGVVTTMHDIHASSRRIADIIGVIDGIAFQTNILALNAAVEAARAGEQGRGFAVVASEVRSLAQRCAEAAKDIKSLISQSNARVEQGSREVDRAGQSMQDILARIDQVSALMRSMAAASDEQRRDIEQIGGAVEQMDQSTQQNAAMVEEIAAAARLLDQESSELSATVSDFIRSNGLERG